MHQKHKNNTKYKRKVAYQSIQIGCVFSKPERNRLAVLSSGVTGVAGGRRGKAHYLRAAKSVPPCDTERQTVNIHFYIRIWIPV